MQYNYLPNAKSMVRARGGDYQNFRNHVRLKTWSISFAQGEVYNFVRSIIALEICPQHDYMWIMEMNKSFILVFNRKNVLDMGSPKSM